MNELLEVQSWMNEISVTLISPLAIQLTIARASDSIFPATELDSYYLNARRVIPREFSVKRSSDVTSIHLL